MLQQERQSYHLVFSYMRSPMSKHRILMHVNFLRKLDEHFHIYRLNGMVGKFLKLLKVLHYKVNVMIYFIE